MDLLIIVELLVVLLALYVGSRYGSLALGAISGIGLALLVFGFQLKPGTPPTDVIYIIIAAVTCAGMLQAAGGMDWMIQLAEKLLRRKPEMITFLAPLCTFFLTVMVGTGHVVYTLMPIICDIALKKGIRSERPCGVASVASQLGITCSPIAAAVASFVVISSAHGFEITNLQVVAVTIPATLCGLLCASALSYRRGIDLDKDPHFQARCANPETYQYMYGHSATLLDKEVTREAKLSVYIFLAALGVIVLFSVCQMLGCDIRPSFVTDQLDAQGQPVVKPLAMNIIIQIVMIAAAAFMVILAKAEPKRVVAGAVWQSGMVAVVAIYGIAWLADTFIGNYMEEMKSALGGVVATYPWAIAFAFFAVSILINSQGAVVVSMLPLAYTLGIPGMVLLGVFPSVYGYFFIPNYPSDIATVNFDRSGTTRIGKYLLNHSFMMPGLVSVFVATVVSYALAMLCF